MTFAVGISLPLTGRAPGVRQLMDELTAEAVRAEASGLGMVVVPEHRQGPQITYCSPLTVASHVLAATNRIQVATGVLVLPAHHPVHVAESVTMLDHLSAGRFRLGVGAGYQRADLEPFGRELADRGRVLEESLEALGLLLGEDESSYHGEHFSFDGVRLRPRPLTTPRPPIWMGSWSAAGIRRAANLCDGWIADPIRTVTEAESMARRYRSAAAEADAAGREVVVMREAWVDDSAPVARRNFAEAIMPVFDYYRRRGALDDAATTFDELADDRFVMGDTAHCAATVQEIAARTGADAVVLQLRHPAGPDHARTREVIDALGEALSAMADVASPLRAGL